MGRLEDQEIADGFRAWLELPADASVDQTLEARPGRVAVHRRLRAELDPIDFIETLLLSAKDEHSLALICHEVQDALFERHPATQQTIFSLSDEEPWATLARYVFGPGQYEEPDQQEPWEPHLNLAQAAEAYVWMGGELEPGETHDDRYHHGAMDFVQHHLSTRDGDPVPLLKFLLRTAQNEAEVDHVVTGPFESALYRTSVHKERILQIAPHEYVELLRSLGT